MEIRHLIVLLGPTASGKSALGVALAKRFNGVIISADSRQVYRGMDIGTGKVTPREMCGVKHFLLDVASPRTTYSVARYVHDVQRTLKKIPSTTPVFLVGGSPFYIDALTKPNSFSFVPPDPVLRRRLAMWTTKQLIALLRKKDPKRLQTIDLANRRRLIRAIEIVSHRRPVRVTELPPMRIMKIGIQVSKERLYRRIDQRVDERMRHGMVAEVRRLHRQGVPWSRLESFGLEYRFLSRYLRGRLNRSQAVVVLKTSIHDFAKRQMTWWKRDPDIQWITKIGQATKLVRRILE